MNDLRAPFRHRPKRRIAMWRRPARVPEYWRVVDFRGPEYMGRQLPAPGTRQMELLRLVREHDVRFHKVKGHADNELNNRCDELARAAIRALSD